MSENAEIIKQSVNMIDVATRYGLRLNRKNAVCCPFHNEKTASFKLYANNKKYHCFGCGADGDVISFVMSYFNISYGQAIARLSNDFGINISGVKKPCLRERIKLQNERRQRERDKNAYQREYDRLFDNYVSATDELVRLQINAKMYAPEAPESPINELYTEAMHKLPYQEYKCSAAQEALSEFEERSRHNAGNNSAGICKNGLSARDRAV